MEASDIGGANVSMSIEKERITGKQSDPAANQECLGPIGSIRTLPG
jgi:hypothetical protein